MAEPFGIAAGAVGIATAFTACVDCFGYVQLGRHFGRDFQTDLLTLNCARLRLTRWGQAVNIYENPKLGKPDATPAEVQTAKNALHQILVLFADTEKISKKYRLNATAGEDLAPRSLSNTASYQCIASPSSNEIGRHNGHRQVSRCEYTLGGKSIHQRTDARNYHAMPRTGTIAGLHTIAAA